MNWINKIKKFGETIKKNINKKFPTKSERESSAWTSCCKGPILKTELEQQFNFIPTSMEYGNNKDYFLSKFMIFCINN